MSFGGLPVFTPVPGSPVQNSGFNIGQLTGGTLTATVGAFAVGATDSARMTTAAVPPVGTFGLPATFGPGPGKWTQADLQALKVGVADFQAGGAGAISDIRVIGIALTGPAPADVTIDIQNEGANAAAAPVVDIDHRHSAIR